MISMLKYEEIIAHFHQVAGPIRIELVFIILSCYISQKYREVVKKGSAQDIGYQISNMRDYRFADGGKREDIPEAANSKASPKSVLWDAV